jgi:hypothetical protein
MTTTGGSADINFNSSVWISYQEAAQAAVYRLGKEHPILRELAIAGLSSIISTFLQKSCNISDAGKIP